jgi:excisionase family DNA binding protein
MTALLARAEAARRLGVSLRTLQRLLARGELGQYRIGGSLRIAEDELDRFIRGTRELASPSTKAPRHHQPPAAVPDFESIR